ncbi:peptidoglycan D,D-transpeptidase FtsI family protein [Acidithiobacillus thiooxidans]|uniref:peptidoglycan D,D-transpeptidase FtsI family protein n=1 Tax=Acidithiobacillus thiooxidans TaxID=930 RepID=UPI001C07BE40|nr:penicillin-binding protein 2 [Acidithiobacillus thiooxidans]MBU2842718.1 penicillin-binding protein 2 [Acidithiobacillus thiooxidans]
MTRTSAYPAKIPARPLPAWRATAVWATVTLAFAAVMAQAWRAQVEHGPFLRDQGAQRYLRHFPLPVQRGPIVDRDGKPLALSVPVKTLWVDPQVFTHQENQWPLVASALGISVNELDARVHAGGSHFAFIARQIGPERAEKISALQIPGLHSLTENRRYYPAGSIAAPLIGFTNVDGKGIEGLELTYNQWLTGKAGEETGLRDNYGHPLSLHGPARSAQPGKVLTLSIDRNLQYVAYTALASAVQRFQARSGAAVLMNARTGEVLAMVSYPAFNPNNRHDYQAGLYNNRAVADTFEPGSVMKPFTIAAALDDNSIQPDSIFNVNTNCFRVARFCIQDDVRHNNLDLAQVLKYSSNIGAAKISLRTPPADLFQMLHQAGFGQGSGLGLPGESPGTLPAWQGWDIARRAAMAYGYGLSVTPLQLAAAYAAIANQGVYIAPTLIRQDTRSVNGIRIMPASTAARLSRWLSGVTSPGGTGFLASIPGYRVAGKTGTSIMANGKGGFHKNQVNTSFVGFAPAQDPRLVMAVVVRAPTQGWRYGGVVAAPVFRVTMAAALQSMGIQPDPSLLKTTAEYPYRTVTEAQQWAEGAGDAAH